MLLTQKAYIEAMRALCYANAHALDLAHGSARPGRPRAAAEARRPAHPAVEGVVHRPRRRADLAGRPGPRRHGLRRGDRRRPALPRRPHRADLRGHQRHPGARPRRSQAALRRRRVRQGLPRRPRAACRRRCPTRSPAIATDLGEAFEVLEETHRLDLRAPRRRRTTSSPAPRPYLRMFATVVGGWLLARGAAAAQRAASTPARATPTSCGQGRHRHGSSPSSSCRRSTAWSARSPPAPTTSTP